MKTSLLTFSLALCLVSPPTDAFADSRRCPVCPDPSGVPSPTRMEIGAPSSRTSPATQSQGVNVDQIRSTQSSRTGSSEAEEAYRESSLAARREAMLRAEQQRVAPVGTRRQPMEVDGANAPGTVGQRDYTGHAFDRMQGRGLTPSTVENAINDGIPSPSSRTPDRIVFDDQNNGVRVVTENNGTVVTVTHIPRTP